MAPNTNIDSLWQEFNDQFPTDADCMKEILRRIGISNTHCKFCGSKNIDLHNDGRAMFCYGCRVRTWLTAGTFFRYVKRPRAWLGAIWLFEHGALFNPYLFHKLVNISYSSALAVFHKVSTAVASNMPGEFPTVNWSEFSSVFGRRSRETPSRQHPSDDEGTDCSETLDGKDTLSDLFPNQHSQDKSTNTANLQTTNLTKVQKSILDNLKATPTNIEEICQKTGVSEGEVISNLTMLELLNLVQSVGTQSFVATKQKQRSSSNSNESSLDGDVVEQINIFMGFVETIFGRISQKYLRQYLGFYWCLNDRTRWNTNSVFNACIKTGSLPYRRLVKSRSPREVLFPATS